MAFFVLDDIPWSQEVPPERDLLDALEAVRQRLEAARSRGERVTWHEAGYECPRFGALTFYSLLFNETSLLPRDLKIELARRLESCVTFDQAQLRAIEVRLPSGQTSVAPSVAWAGQAQLTSSEAVGCISPRISNRQGPVDVHLCEDLNTTTTLIFCGDESGHCGFFRHALRYERAYSAEEFGVLAPSAFPRLYFVDGVFGGIRDLSQPIQNRMNDLVAHLGILNDAGLEIFSGGTNQAVIDGFRGHGVLVSPENIETSRDGRCRKARERIVGGKTLYFEWHTKIEPHVDRIHFHKAENESGNKVIIGIIHRHLPLPGN